MKPFLEEIHEHLQAILGMDLLFQFDTLYLGNLPFDEMDTNDRKLTLILLVACKKAITRKWMQPQRPTTEEWTEIVYEIYKMEKLSHTLRAQEDKFYWIWSKWTEYIKPACPELCL